MMKIKILIALAFACCAESSHAEDFTGRIHCEVKSNGVTGIIEGKPVEYTGYQDGIQVGETLALTYQSILGSSEYITFRLKDEKRDKLYAWNAFDADFDIAKTDVYSDSDGSAFYSPDAFLELGRDRIRFSDYRTNVYLDRYYKSDWQGIATFAQQLMHQTVTLDCRHTRDRIEEVVEKMKSWKK